MNDLGNVTHWCDGGRQRLRVREVGRGECARSPAHLALGPARSQTGHRALTHQSTFELSECNEDIQHQSSATDRSPTSREARSSRSQR
jgi:hypothetical protein